MPVDDQAFAFTAGKLRALHNPKNPAAFRELGGLQGLAVGLRTNLLAGLDADETTLGGEASPETRNTSTSTKEGLSPSPGLHSAQTTAVEVPLPRPPKSGLFVTRKQAFLDNTLPTKKHPTFPQLLWMTYNDPVLFLLTAAAAVALAIGLYQSLEAEREPGTSSVQWVESVAILVAVFVIVIVGAGNDWEKLRQFQKLNKKQLEREVKVLRSGAPRLILISDVLVGDVLQLEPGDVVPADGILIDGYNVICDESTVTGESDAIHKQPGGDVFRALVEGRREPDPLDPGLDPFLLSGTKVMEGIGTCLVTSTGLNSTYGKILDTLDDDRELTPLQQRLTVLAKRIAWSGASLTILLFVALFIKFLAGLPHSTQSPAEKGQVFIDILIISLTVLVIAVPEGLPLAVTLSLAYASTRMLKEHNLVRRLQACEAMGNATNICSDKTGTLTQNDMRVVAGTVGSSLRFVDELSPSAAGKESSNGAPKEEQKPGGSGEVTGALAADVRSLLKQSLALNTTAIERSCEGQLFAGSGTETALLRFARERLAMGPLELERSSERVTQVIPFNAERQCMTTVVEVPSESKPRYRALIKGASEVLLARCSQVVQDPARGTSTVNMSPEDRRRLADTIEAYSSQALRTISLAYSEFSPRPLEEGGAPAPAGKTSFEGEDLSQNLVFLAVVGIHDPLRPGVPAAVQACRNAGITVRMVTGDNIKTARAIAEQSGILETDSAHDIVMEGSEFRALSDAQLDEKLPRLKVVARSSPGDKQRLVLRLKEKGEIVAVTGDGTNDVAALSAADVSFSMGGLSGTEVAREASSIILMNDDFACVVKALMWGRTVNDSVKKFLQVSVGLSRSAALPGSPGFLHLAKLRQCLRPSFFIQPSPVAENIILLTQPGPPWKQFQITITITSVLAAFVSSIANPNEQSILTAVQLMWVNLFQDTMAALALATDKPQRRVLHRKPEPRSAPLISTAMWKTVIGQSVYQLAVTLVLYFAGDRILSYTTDLQEMQLATLVFNTYVWLQIFNMYK